MIDFYEQIGRPNLRTARLTLAQVQQIRRDALAGATPLQLSQRYGVTRQQVGKIVRGKAWRGSDATT